jgi:hypothetical protein
MQVMPDDTRTRMLQHGCRTADAEGRSLARAPELAPFIKYAGAFPRRINL